MRHSIKTKTLLGFILLMTITLLGCTSTTPPNPVPEKETTKPVEATDEKNVLKPAPEVCNSGLLIGLSKNPNPKDTYVMDLKGNTYRTLWIYPSENKMTFVEKKNVVVVPYKDAFYALENDHFLQSEANNDGTEQSMDVFQNYQEYFDFTTIVGSKLKGNAAEKMTESLFKKIYLAGEEGSVWPYMKRTERLLYAGNHYACIAFDYYETGGGTYSYGQHDIAWYEISDLLSLDRTDRSSKVLELMSTKDQDNLKQKVAQFEVIEHKEGLMTDIENITGKTMKLSRKDGAFKFELPVYIDFAHEGNGRSNHSISSWIDVDYSVPKEIALSERLCMEWTDIVKHIPEAKDAYSSPKEDLLVVMTPNQLQVYLEPLKGLEKPAMTIPVDKDETVILNQWATGKYIDQWTSVLK